MSLTSIALVVALSSPSEGPTSEQHTRRIGIAGGVIFGLGVAAGATAIGLVPRRNRLANRYADAASPAALGFPAARYEDFREMDRDIARMNIAIRVLTWTAVTGVIAGATVLIVYGARKRRARNSVAWSGGFSLRF